MTAAAAPGSPANAPNRMPTAADLQPLAAPLLAAIKAEPKNFENLVQLGNLYYDHQVFPEAIEYYARALELQPKDPNVRTDLGTAYWYSGFPEKAVAEYQKSLAVDPAHTNTLFNLGVVQLEGMKNPAAAIAAFEKLLAVNPTAPQRERALELMGKARGMKP
jgi:tetratricopeptide (TPR) repeat protein